ncbi:MAG: PDZ domain-containing protein [Bdellovibrionales bacterium]|nr:PDZ domain-containing protein [Bdellovibrionales bacterium]
MKALFIFSFLFIGVVASAKQINCTEMKTSFYKAMAEEHVYGKQENYLKELFTDHELWLSVRENLINNYDYNKFFFFKEEVDVKNQNKYQLAEDVGYSFFYESEKCNFLDRFYKKFQAAMLRHEEIFNKLLVNRAKLYEEVKELAALEYQQLTPEDQKLLDNFPEDKVELEQKIKLNIAGKFKIYKKFEGVEREAFNVAIKDLELLHNDKELLDPEHVYKVGLNVGISAFDKHSSFLWDGLAKEFLGQIRGYSGVGVEIVLSNRGMRVVNLTIPQRHGLRVGDIIVTVDGQDLSNMNVFYAQDLLNGNNNSVAKLDILRNDQFKTLNVIREVVPAEAIVSHKEIIVSQNKKFGYFAFKHFYQALKGDDDKIIKNGVAEDFRIALNEFNAKNVEGLIIDLRFNDGGSLQESLKMISMLIPEGPLLQLGNIKKNSIEVDEDKGQVIFDKPIVVLVNHLSASASEIFAGVLQDYNRAVIAGASRTYGKGSVQTLIPYDERLTELPISELQKASHILKVTRYFYYLPSGRPLQGEGVEPDLYIPESAPELLIGFKSEKEQNPRLTTHQQLTNLLSYNKLWQSHSEKAKKIMSAQWTLNNIQLPVLEPRSAQVVTLNTPSIAQADDTQLELSLMSLNAIVKDRGNELKRISSL